MARKKIATVLGTRPEIVKLCIFIEAMDEADSDHVLIHTGQHYDYEMDALFMEELRVRAPDYRLSPPRSSQTSQLGDMISKLGDLFSTLSLDAVVVLGDTNSTLAGAIASKKSGIPLVHVEAGCRSYDMTMPEEQNRVLVDHVSDILFAPTSSCVQNLAKEGISSSGVHLVGSTLLDACMRNLEIARTKAGPDLPGRYALMTIHRAVNVSNRDRLQAILDAMATVSEELPVIFPVHPHTRIVMEQWNLLSTLRGITPWPPLGYLEFLRVLSGAEFVLTDSGGVQQEAQVLGVPILTARRETEWIETVESGGCRLVDADKEEIIKSSIKILHDAAYRASFRSSQNPYRESEVSKKIVDIILASL